MPDKLTEALIKVDDGMSAEGAAEGSQGWSAQRATPGIELSRIRALKRATERGI